MYSLFSLLKNAFWIRFLAKTGAFAHEKKKKKKKRTQLKLKKRGRKCSSVLTLPSFLGCHGKRKTIRCKANKHTRGLGRGGPRN